MVIVPNKIIGTILNAFLREIVRLGIIIMLIMTANNPVLVPNSVAVIKHKKTVLK